MIEADIPPTIFYGGLLLVLVVAVIAHWNKMGNIQRDLGRLEVTVAGLDAKIDAVETSLNTRIDAVETSLNTKIDTLQASIDALAKTQHEMQLQMQRNHYQLMMAILSHSHRPDGRPTFDLPPDFEPPPASE